MDVVNLMVLLVPPKSFTIGCYKRFKSSVYDCYLLRVEEFLRLEGMDPPF